MKALIDNFLATVRGLDAGRGTGWTYYLDLLSSIEDHRDELRHAEWPDAFDILESDTYRALLIKLEDELRKMLTTVPLMKDPDAGKYAMDFFNGMMVGFLARADAVSEKLGGATQH